MVERMSGYSRQGQMLPFSYPRASPFLLQNPDSLCVAVYPVKYSPPPHSLAAGRDQVPASAQEGIVGLHSEVFLGKLVFS